MGNRLSKIYTRTGDDGTTGLGDGSRTEKDGARVSAYGTTDELNSIIGMVLAQPLPDKVDRVLHEIQHHLFDLGGELCIPGHQAIQDSHIDWLEATLDHFNDALPPLKDFILPGGRVLRQTVTWRVLCADVLNAMSSAYSEPKKCRLFQ